MTRIYTVINKEDGMVLTADTNVENIKNHLFSDRYVEVWENGKQIKTIDGKDKNNEEVWK